MLRLAIIGCGNHSEGNHAQPLAHYAMQHPQEVSFVAACDLRQERAAYYCERYGFAQAYTEMETMLRTEEPDGVVCILPQEKIVEIGVELLNRGIPCVVEKPLGDSLSETEQLVKAAQRTGTQHQVSVNRRFAPYINRAIDWASGKGPIRYVRGTMLRHRRREDAFAWGTGIHVTDTVRYLGGDVASFDIQPIGYSEMSAAWFCLDLRFATGCVGRVEVFPTDGMEAEVYEMFGENFRARAAMPCGARGTGAELECWSNGQLQESATPAENDPVWLTNGAYKEVEEFVHCLRTGDDARSQIPDVAQSMQIVGAAAESIAEHPWRSA